MLVFSLFLVSSIGIFMNGIVHSSASALEFHDSCPKWSEWVNSTECVMPGELEYLVHQLCPRHPSDRTRGRTRGLFVDDPFFDIVGQFMVPWGESSRRRPNGARFHGSSLYPDRPPSPPRNHYPHRRPSHPPRGIPQGPPVRFPSGSKRPNPWKDIYTECGGCSIEVRCRSRPPEFACSPTLEVERASCSHSLNQPACQLPPRTCAAINRTLAADFSGGHHGSGGIPQKRMMENRWKKMQTKWNQNPRQGGGRGSRRNHRMRSLDDENLPDFNCEKSHKGCVCCCRPFVPKNGLCVPAPPPAVHDHKDSPDSILEPVHLMPAVEGPEHNNKPVNPDNLNSEPHIHKPEAGHSQKPTGQHSNGSQVPKVPHSSPGNSGNSGEQNPTEIQHGNSDLDNHKGHNVFVPPAPFFPEPEQQHKTPEPENPDKHVSPETDPKHNKDSEIEILGEAIPVNPSNPENHEKPVQDTTKENQINDPQPAEPEKNTDTNKPDSQQSRTAESIFENNAAKPVKKQLMKFDSKEW